MLKTATSLLKSPAATIDYDKPIPSPEDVSPEYQRLRARQNQLIDAEKALEVEVGKIKAEIGAYTRGRVQADQVAALIEGVQFKAPPPLSDRLGEIEQQKRLIFSALEEVAKLIQVEHHRASALVAAEFEAERMALAKECYSHLALAISAHSKFGLIKQRLERAGVDSSALYDFGRDLLGWPLQRNDHASYAMRLGVTRGYIAAADVPKGYL